MNDAMSKAAFSAEIAFVDTNVLSFVGDETDHLVFFRFGLYGAPPGTIPANSVVTVEQGGQSTSLGRHIHECPSWAHSNTLAAELAIQGFLVGGADHGFHASLMKVQRLNTLNFITGSDA